MDENKPVEEDIVFSDQQRIIVLIVMEMTLGVIGIFINLMVVSTVRSEDSLQEDTNNLLLANICFSNLVVSFLVKPISAIYVSYALSTGEWKVGLAFCSLYTLAFRTTWLVFPFTMVALCWNCLTNICCHPHPRTGSVTIQETAGAGAIINIHSDQQTVQSFQSDREFQRTKRSLAFPTIRQKSIIGCVWAFATLYGLAACFPEKIFGGDDEPWKIRRGSHNQNPDLIKTFNPQSTTLNTDLTFCPVRSKPDNLLDKITVYLSIYIPTILGPFITFVIGVVCLPFSSGWRSRGISPCSLLLLPGLILIHLSNYYINLVLAHTHQNEFHYILVKYGLGFSFIILSPLLVIATQKDIRIGVKKTFKSSVLFAVQNMEKN